FSHLCARRVGEQLNQMIEEVPLTQADIDQIRQTLDKKIATNTIPCDCLPGQCHCHHAAESLE
ncbi:MAG: CopY/TcrY family copper transport repressor, partial [Enterococcus aquimarinus]|nr:CopY/TcrY family copper transport repressor [Enterococcus aquimarinus]